MRSPFFAAAAAALLGAPSAQTPILSVEPAASYGSTVDSVLIGPPGQPYATLADVDGGPTPLRGQSLLLGLTPALAVIDAGVLSPGGLRVQQLQAPPAAGAPRALLYLQSFVPDASAPAGIATSGGESLLLHPATELVIVDKILDAQAQGYTGEFDRSVFGRLQGLPARFRTQTIELAAGALFGQPVAGPLNPEGARVQTVYRAVDLGATGVPEIVRAIRWRSFGPVIDDDFAQLAMDLSHTSVVPDYTVGLFSALPMFPLSGLVRDFGTNPRSGETPVRVYQGPYTVRAASLQPDGYVPYPAPQTPFTYNGTDSLLIDFKMAASSAVGGNGQQVRLMVLSSAQPFSRVHSQGLPGQPLDPFTVTSATSGGNEVHDLQIEFAQVRSQVVSPWQPKPVRPPIGAVVAASIPDGASVEVEFRGRLAPGVVGPWLKSLVAVGGSAEFQTRITLNADLTTGAAPSVDAVYHVFQ